MFADNPDARAESLQMLTDYLVALFEPEDTIEFRCLKARRKTVQRWVTLAELPGIHQALCDLNDDGFNVYFGANPRTVVGGATADEVEIARAHYIDMDGGVLPGELVERVAQAGLREPTAVVFTGGGSQAAFRLTEPMPVAEWCARQTALNATIDGADSTICDAPRILRCPGFVNRKPKYGPAFPMARVEHTSGHIFTADEFPTMPEGTPAAYEGPGADGEPVRLNIETNGLLPKFVTDFLTEGTLIQPKGKALPSRRETAFRVAIEMAAAQIAADEAETRICARLFALGLDEADVADFRERQLRNAYGQERTPTIDPEHLPVAVARPMPAEPEVTITDAGNGKHRVVCRRGLKSHIDTLDLSKQSARAKFLKDAAAALGEGTDTTFVDDRLKAVATGDEQAAEPEVAPSTGLTREDFISVDDMVRPERFAVQVDDAFTAGTTVARFRPGEDGGAVGVWLTFITRHDGTREAIELPNTITVGDSSFLVHPKIPAPAVEPKLGWSENSQWQWVDDGKATMPPADLFRELVSAFEKFLDIQSDVRQGMLETMALWVISTYLADQFEVIAYLAITGPKGSGKSRAMQCLNQTVFRAHMVANPTAAALYRHLHVQGGTVIVDEAENLEQADPGSGLPQTLLTSNTRGMSVPRCEGENNTPTNFCVYGPKAFISIAEPHEPLLDRAVHFRMFRAPPGSPKATLHPKSSRHRLLWQRLRDGLNTMVLAHASDFLALPDADQVVPDGMFPRSMETWSSLLQIAAVMERLGVPGLLARMQTFARGHSEGSEQATVPSEHEALLKAFVTLRTKGRPTTSAAVLAQAYLEGLDAQVKMTDKAAGKVLSGYGLARGAGRKRYEWAATDAQLARIQESYGIQLVEAPGQPEKTADTPPGKTLTVAHTLTSGVFPEGNTTFQCAGSVCGEHSTASTPGAAPGGGEGVCVQWNAHTPDSHTGSLTQKTPENTGETAVGERVSDGERFLEGCPDNFSGKVTL